MQAHQLTFIVTGEMDELPLEYKVWLVKVSKTFCTVTPCFITQSGTTGQIRTDNRHSDAESDAITR
jgi:hypothetical protein